MLRIKFQICFTVITCGRPRDPQNGYHEDRSYTFDRSVTYKCHRGHTIIGATRSRCLATGQWSNPPPTCQRKRLQFLYIFVKTPL